MPWPALGKGGSLYRHVDLGSVWRGLWAMRPIEAGVEPARWTMRRVAGKPRWWIVAWTPIWHDGRGPYVSVGLGLFAIYRGY